MENVLKYNKQELLTRVDIPLYMKSGYADHSEEVLEKYPNRKYYGNPVYHNLRYRFQYRNQLYMGLTAEKDAGEPFFCKYNKKDMISILLISFTGRKEVEVVGDR